MNSTKIVRLFVIVALVMAIVGCHGAEKSAGMALDSAASAIRSGDEKIWIDPDATPTPEYP